MKKILAVVFSLLMLAGCSTFGPIVAKDFSDFQDLAAKYGTVNDWSCASLANEIWKYQMEVSNTEVDGAVATAYKLILLNRAQSAAKDQMVSSCGHLAAELVVAFGKVATKVRP